MKMKEIKGLVRASQAQITKAPFLVASLATAWKQLRLSKKLARLKRKGASEHANPDYPNLCAVSGATYYAISDATGRMDDGVFQYLDSRKPLSNGTGV